MAHFFTAYVAQTPTYKENQRQVPSKVVHHTTLFSNDESKFNISNNCRTFQRSKSWAVEQFFSRMPFSQCKDNTSKCELKVHSHVLGFVECGKQ